MGWGADGKDHVQSLYCTVQTPIENNIDYLDFSGRCIFLIIISSGNHTPSIKQILSHIVVWERDFNHEQMTGDELHDSAERGPVDRDGARRTKS